jgi:subtilisin family serine protease
MRRLAALFGLALFVTLVSWRTGAADFAIGVLPDGAGYYTDKIVIIGKIDSPPFITGESVSGLALSGVPSVDDLCRQYGVIRIEPFYPGRLKHPALARELSRIYIFTLAEDADARLLLDKFASDPNLESADLYGAPEPCFIPDDPRVTDQWHLQHTNAYGAWDIVRGDTTRHAVIGIVDSGIYWNHPDLAGNIWVNAAEDANGNGIFDPADNNGTDADSNGFIDDVIGWDLGDNDNDPVESSSMIHGTPVAGAASEVTNNDFQGAAIGFRARLMPIKVFNSLGQLAQAYQGMIYAGDNGAQVINCAWGLRGPYSQAEQNIINALHDEDVLVIASAAGFGDTVRVYPGAYDHVMAVASTDRNDHRASFSGHGTWVDICAPGVDILTTYPQNQFATYSGTSFSAAQVSGLAALIRAWYPQLPVDFVETLIEVSADSIPGNNGLLGAGRINCYNALAIISASDPATPDAFSLSQNYPNPFNAATVIRYVLPSMSDVRIDIYDILGKRVETLRDARQSSGAHSIIWSPRNSSSGLYFFRLTCDGESRSIPMIYAK